MMNRLICAAGVLSCIGAAQAATVNLTFTGSGLNTSMNIVDVSLGRTLNGVRAGQLNWYVSSSDYGPVLAGTNIFTYCTDISQFVGNGPLTIVDLAAAPNPGQAMGADRAALIRKLYATSYSAANTAGDKAAAFQIALWEIVNEANFVAGNTRGASGLDVFSGDFYASNSNAIRNLANGYIDSAFADSTNGTRLVAGVSPTLQDQVFIVPLPTAAGLGFVGLVGLAGARRRR